MTDRLVHLARQRAESSPIPEEWGYRLVLEVGESFLGRWRGETVDAKNTDDAGNPRRIFLLWDEHGERCFSRFYAALGREIDRAKPGTGDTIVIYRGDDYAGAQGTGYTFGVEAESNNAPLPDTDERGKDGI